MTSLKPKAVGGGNDRKLRRLEPGVISKLFAVGGVQAGGLNIRFSLKRKQGFVRGSFVLKGEGCPRVFGEDIGEDRHIAHRGPAKFQQLIHRQHPAGQHQHGRAG